MYPPQHQRPSQMEFIPAGPGLEEFEVEGGQELRVFSVVEQYDLSIASSREPDWPVAPRRAGTSASRGGRRAGRLLTRLASAVVFVAIPSGTPVGTEKLPEPALAPPAHLLTATVEAPLAPVATPPPAAAAPRGSRPAEPRGGEQRVPRPTTAPAVPEVRTEPASAPQLAALRQAFASLDGPFMTFEHCEVRLAAADRALARCLGTRTEADRAGASPPQRHVEWTLEFDRVQQRWLIVDAAGR